MDYIVACSRHPGATRKIGHELLFCLYNTALTSAEPSFASDAWTAGARLAWRWHVYTRRLAARRATGDRDALLDIMHGLYGASHFGCVDSELLAATASRLNSLSIRRLLGFDPQRARPTSAAVACKCGRLDRGRATVCSSCGRKLVIADAYEIWQHALVVTHAGECLHTVLGAPFKLVAAWRDAMIPYVDPDTDDDDRAFDCFYAVTHLLYTLTDYGVYTLPRGVLRTERIYLEAMLARAIRNEDQEMVSEASECLHLFPSESGGATPARPLAYLMDRQCDDGSWGGDDWYDRLHRAWVGFDALREWSHPGGERSRQWMYETLAGADSA